MIVTHKIVHPGLFTLMFKMYSFSYIHLNYFGIHYKPFTVSKSRQMKKGVCNFHGDESNWNIIHSLEKVNHVGVSLTQTPWLT